MPLILRRPTALLELDLANKNLQKGCILNGAHFLDLILDSLPNQISVIDSEGIIIYVNKAWVNFGLENGLSEQYIWHGRNYLQTCASGVDEVGDQISPISNGIKRVIAGRQESFSTEYPCDSPSKRRWFMMHASKLQGEENSLFLISHTDITKRKIAEEAVERLSMSDQLTGLANRHYFNVFLTQEWKRAARSQMPVSILLIDIDCFKLYNDSFGHVRGDECLCQVSDIIKKYARRATDLAVRFGGEEFILVYGSSQQQYGIELAEALRQEIANLNIPINDALMVTVSIGVAAMVPTQDLNSTDLITQADEALYQAKKNGRNCVEVYKQTF